MADQEQKREAALRHIMATVQLDQSRGAFGLACARAAYDAAIADNAERMRELSLEVVSLTGALNDATLSNEVGNKALAAAESALAEARSIADRPLGTHIDYEPMDMIRDLQKALGTRVHDREPCRCGNVKALAEARATIERLEGGDHEEGDCALAESTIERLDEALCSLLHKGDDEGEHSPEAHLKLFQNQGGHEPTFDDLCDRVFARARREGFVCKINLSRPRKRKMRKVST